MTQSNIVTHQPFNPAIAARSTNGFDMLILKTRMTDTARCLLEAMGVYIEERRSTSMPGPAMYHLWSPEPRPRVSWLNASQAESFTEALRTEEDRFRSPAWVHVLMTAHRAGALRDMDGGIELGDKGIDTDLVLRDLLHCPRRPALDQRPRREYAAIRS